MGCTGIGTEMIEDMRIAKDDQLCTKIATNEIVASDILFGPEILEDDCHADIIRGQVTRNLTDWFPDVNDEISAAFSELVPAKANDRIEAAAYKTVVDIIIRGSNRLFVRLSLCCDKDYMKSQQRSTFDAFIATRLLALFPSALRSFMTRFTNVNCQINCALKRLKPIIEERIAKVDKLGPDYPGKPNDVISWCLEYAKGDQRTPHDLNKRMLILNLGTIFSLIFYMIWPLTLHTFLRCERKLKRS